MKNAVLISLELRFSPKDEDRHIDCWVVGSDDNVRAAAQLRETKRVKSVTTFDDLGDAVRNVTSMIPTMIEHHPSATVIIVRGINPAHHVELIKASPSFWTGTSIADEIIFVKDRSSP